MKITSVISIFVALACATPNLYAGHGRHGGGNGYRDLARVLDVEPIVRTVEIPQRHRDCRIEEVRHDRRGFHPGAATLIGGVAGGVVGHEIGRNDIKPLTAALGAVFGAAAGNHLVGGDRGPYYTTEERCRVVEDIVTEERVSGYRVTYRYQGRTYVRRMDHDPGEFVRVRVNVSAIPD